MSILNVAPLSMMLPVAHMFSDSLRGIGTASETQSGLLRMKSGLHELNLSFDGKCGQLSQHSEQGLAQLHCLCLNFQSRSTRKKSWDCKEKNQGSCKLHFGMGVV